MDDILLVGQDEQELLNIGEHLIEKLVARGFNISTDKVQLQPPQLFLCFELPLNQIKTQKVQIRTSNFKTLNDFQKLLGTLIGCAHILN